jgi:hypothetical protein
MRIAGHAFLIVGFLLCISIALAAIGFFAMGFGLIFLLIAEEREKASALRSRCTETWSKSDSRLLLGGSLGCEGPFGFERRGMGADGAADHRSA